MANTISIENPFDFSGIAMISATALMSVWNYLPHSLKDFNELVIACTGVLGFFYVVAKLIGVRLDNKLKRKKLKEPEKDGND